MAAITIIDDDPDCCRLMSLLLNQLGHRAACVVGGEGALQALRLRKPDLVLLDVMMPGISGLQLLGQMREDPDLRRVAVVMFSAVSDTQVQEESRRLGAVDYLVKGGDWDTLIARIEACLRGAMREAPGPSCART